MDPASAPRARIRGWSLRLGRMAGVDVYVHATFFALLAWLAASGIARRDPAVTVVTSLSTVLGVFACVVLHELGHALAARRYGVPTRDITLYPIGGVASLERIPSNPTQELVIAVAGPLVNLILAVALFGVVWLSSLGGPPGLDPSSLIVQLLVANLGLAAFNLLPAFPMDGGRALRALLARRMGRVAATRVAARVGRAMAVVFTVLGFFVGANLILVGLFVWIAGQHEARAVEVDDVLEGVTVARAMETRFFVLQPSDPLALARTSILACAQVDIPVVAVDGTFLGLVGREEVARGIEQGGEGAPISALARRDVVPVRPDEPLRGALARLASCPWRTAPVVDPSGKLLGLLSLDNVTELVMFREAAMRRRGDAVPGVAVAGAAS